MAQMLIGRRAFLQGAGLAFATLLPQIQAHALSRTDAIYASAYQAPDRTHGFALFTEDGKLLSEHNLVGRGHGFASCKVTGWNVAFARAPGNFALGFKSSEASEPVAFSAPESRHFYGHGAFSADGKLLYATENDFGNDAGIIGIYEPENSWRRIGEFSSGGIGPHEMLLAPDGKSLWVANGGISTHPDTGKIKLNLDTMRSSISLIDLNTGAIKGRWETPENLQRLSLRHMALDAKGMLWIGAQHEGANTDDVPLIARCSMDQPLAFVDLQQGFQPRLRNYIGSVASSADGNRIGFTSPTGGARLVIEVSSGKQNLRVEPEVCGIAGRGAGFVFSTENGELDGRHHNRFWDNHIMQIA
jgi:uncharacterized protein